MSPSLAVPNSPGVSRRLRTTEGRKERPARNQKKKKKSRKEKAEKNEPDGKRKEEPSGGEGMGERERIARILIPLPRY